MLLRGTISLKNAHERQRPRDIQKTRSPKNLGKIFKKIKNVN